MFQIISVFSLSIPVGSSKSETVKIYPLILNWNFTKMWQLVFCGKGEMESVREHGTTENIQL